MISITEKGDKTSHPRVSPKKVLLRHSIQLWGKTTPFWERHGHMSLAKKRKKKLEEKNEGKPPLYTLNTILGGFVRGSESSSPRKRYARQVIHVVDSVLKP